MSPQTRKLRLAALAFATPIPCGDGWLLGRVRDAAIWPSTHYERVAREERQAHSAAEQALERVRLPVAARDGAGALINRLASEPEMGSPSRGGRMVVFHPGALGETR